MTNEERIDQALNWHRIRYTTKWRAGNTVTIGSWGGTLADVRTLAQLGFTFDWHINKRYGVPYLWIDIHNAPTIKPCKTTVTFDGEIPDAHFKRYFRAWFWYHARVAIYFYGIAAKVKIYLAITQVGGCVIDYIAPLTDDKRELERILDELSAYVGLDYHNAPSESLYHLRQLVPYQYRSMARIERYQARLHTHKDDSEQSHAGVPKQGAQ